MKYNNAELTKQEEKQKNVAILEYMKSINEFHKYRKKKFIIISLIIIFIIIAIKVLFGTIELYNIFGYPSTYARYYKVTVNDKQVAVSYTFDRKIPLIPFLVNFNSVYLGNSNIKNNDDGPFFYKDGSENYYINISSYKCYNNNDMQVECTNNEQNMIATNDERFTKLTITRITNPYGIIYDGDFTNNITPYVTTIKGEYCIEITSKYGFNETIIHFYFDNFEKET
jgi:hypothetical protein